MTVLPTKRLFTVGHSTRDFEEFVRLLQSQEIRCLVDVRIIPKSRRMPYFNAATLAKSLPTDGIEYLHEADLGGRRRPASDSENTGWKVEGFRGYADHMATPKFEAALARVEKVATGRRTAVMCAEALWWRCHRRLIADALVVRGWRVVHIGLGSDPEDHELTSFAVVEGNRLTYPPAQGALLP